MDDDYGCDYGYEPDYHHHSGYYDEPERCDMYYDECDCEYCEELEAEIDELIDNDYDRSRRASGRSSDYSSISDEGRIVPMPYRSQRQPRQQTNQPKPIKQPKQPSHPKKRKAAPVTPEPSAEENERVLQALAEVRREKELKQKIKELQKGIALLKVENHNLEKKLEPLQEIEQLYLEEKSRTRSTIKWCIVICTIALLVLFMVLMNLYTPPTVVL